MDWLDASDLPDNYDDLKIQHRSDAIRIALLERYGGAWIDVSTFLLKPLSEIFPMEAGSRAFVDLDTKIQNEHRNDGRVQWTDYIENWLMLTPPNDPLFHRTKECCNKLRKIIHSKKKLPFFHNSFGWTGMFTPRQIEELASLQINPYLSMHA